MTISSTVNRWSYTGDAVSTVFAYTNKIFAAADLRVLVDGVLRTLTTDYAVSGLGLAGGGNVTFTTPPAGGASIVIIRQLAYTQPTDLIDSGPFPADRTEDALDRATILAQQLADASLRTLRQPDADTAAIGVLPARAARASRVLGFDAAGDPIPTDGSAIGGAVVSAFMATVLDDASAAAARATLGAGTGNGTADHPAQGANIVSAATLTLSADLDEQTFTVTGGTGPITAITARPVGSPLRLVFTGTPQINHNASTLILLSGANITIAAGDVLELVATAAGWRMTGYARASGQALVAPVQVFGGSFASVDQAITLGGLITVAHGLGARPVAIFTYLRCAVAELNWSVGDELVLPNGADGGSGASNTVVGIYADATNIYVRVGAGAPIIPNKNTGAYSGITPANWRVKLYAFA
jgi:hypothetical protein